MSQRNRRTLAKAGLLAALFLALPMPSQAAGPWEPGIVVGVATRAWSWLENLGLIPRQPAPAQRPVSRWEKQGSMIDPNGGHWVTIPTAPSVDPSDQGSGIDPNGHR